MKTKQKRKKKLDNLNSKLATLLHLVTTSTLDDLSLSLLCISRGPIGRRICSAFRFCHTTSTATCRYVKAYDLPIGTDSQLFLGFARLGLEDLPRGQFGVYNYATELVFKTIEHRELVKLKLIHRTRTKLREKNVEIDSICSALKSLLLEKIKTLHKLSSDPTQTLGLALRDLYSKCSEHCTD